MQKIFLTGFIFSVFVSLNAAEISIEISEKINISSDNIEINEGKIEFNNNVYFQSKSYEIYGEVAEYERVSEVIRILGAPVKFNITSENNFFKGSSEMIFIRKNEIEILGSVLIENDSSKMKGEIIKFNLKSGELLIN